MTGIAGGPVGPPFLKYWVAISITNGSMSGIFLLEYCLGREEELISLILEDAERQE